MVCTSAALVVVSKAPRDLARILGAGLLLGLGVAGMHYLGMYGMKIGGYINWGLRTVALSVLIAVAAGTAALWLAFNTRSMASRAGAALLMAAAVCAMHYTGMGAAEFICTSPNRFATVQGTGLISSLGLGPTVAACAFAMAVLLSVNLYVQWMQRSVGQQRRRTA